MPHYVALLRGVNVGGRTVRMDRLRAVLGAIGLTEVETVIASGNVLFRSPSRAEAALEARIESALEKAFGFAVTTMVRSAGEMAQVASLGPFGGLDGTASVHVAFLKTPPAKAAAAKVLALRCPPEDVHIDGRELYIAIPGRMSDSSVFRAPLEKLLGVPMTVRNANTVRKLAGRTAR